MACPPVVTGSQFLVQTLAHIDCQAQVLGSFGYQALAQAGSPAGLALTGLLTLFIALYGIRLLFGSGGQPHDVVGAVLKIGIVLTLAVSWPAWRILAYDTILYGPAELAAAITPTSTLPDPTANFVQRLQAIDSNIAALTYTGTGRQTGELTEEAPAAGFRSIAMEDETGLGWARWLYLATVIGSLATLRIAAGLLLALAPLFAGLLLFDLTRGVFMGWLRGLLLTALGSLGLTTLLSVEVALIEPWLLDVLSRRSLGYATPTAPTELLALVAAFALATAGLLFLLAKVAFQESWSFRFDRPGRTEIQRVPPSMSQMGGMNAIPVHSRAVAISESVASSIQREDRLLSGGLPPRLIGSGTIDRERGDAGPTPLSTNPLGSGYRRTMRSELSSHRQRNQRP